MIFQTDNFDEIKMMKAESGVSTEEGKRLAFLSSCVPQGGLIIEIGACQGVSTAYIASVIRQKKLKIDFWSIDLWDLGKALTPTKHWNSYKKYKRNIKGLGLWGYVNPIKIDSQEMAIKFAEKNRLIDFLFIDGGHKYEEVSADILSWSKYISPGGAISLHDADHPKTPGVRKAISEHITDREWTDFEQTKSVFSARKRI